MRELVFHQFLTPDFYTTTNKTSLYGTSGTGSRHHTRRPDEPKTKNQVKMHSSQNQFEPRPDSIHDRPSRKKTTPVFSRTSSENLFLVYKFEPRPDSIHDHPSRKKTTPAFSRTSSENLLLVYKLYLSLQNTTCSFKLPVSEMSKCAISNSSTSVPNSEILRRPIGRPH
jgi:hypothetical protein